MALDGINGIALSGLTAINGIAKSGLSEIDGQTIGGGGGGIALVASAGAGSANGTPATTAAIDTTGANLLIAILADGSGNSNPCTDSKGNTWTQLTVYINGGLRQAIQYCVPSSVGSGHTVSTAFGYSSVDFLAFSGAHATPLDSSTGATATPGTSTYQLGAGLTPGQNGSLVIAALTAYPDIEPSSVDGGFNITYAIGYNVTSSLVAAYLIQTSAAAANPTWTGSANMAEATSSMAVFKPA